MVKLTKEVDMPTDDVVKPSRVEPNGSDVLGAFFKAIGVMMLAILALGLIIKVVFEVLIAGLR